MLNVFPALSFERNGSYKVLETGERQDFEKVLGTEVMESNEFGEDPESGFRTTSDRVEKASKLGDTSCVRPRILMAFFSA